MKSGDEHGYSFEILKSVISVNDVQKTALIPKIKNYFKGDLKDKKIAIWGLAFKPNTDDIREAPALFIIDALLSEGASVVAYDPEAMDNVRELIADKISFAQDEYQVIEQADALVICTEWGVFRNPDFVKIAEKMNDKVIFDGRNLFNLQDMNKRGFYYYSIGRETIN